MNITEKIAPGRDYFWKRTPSWTWIDGRERWWEVFVNFHDGMNGAGGLFVRELWRWNDSSQTVYDVPRNLSYEESVELVAQVEANLVG